MERCLGCQENDDQHLQLMDYRWHPLKRGRIAETPVQTLGNMQYIQSNYSPLLQSPLLPFFNLHRVADNYSLIHGELKALQRYEREGANIRNFCQRKNILCKGADPAPYTWLYFETCQLGFTKQSSSFLQLVLLFSSWESISAPIAIPLPPTTQEGGAGSSGIDFSIVRGGVDEMGGRNGGGRYRVHQELGCLRRVSMAERSLGVTFDIEYKING